MHSTISYIKHIFAFQKGLQIQLHKDSLWKRQQLLVSEQVFVYVPRGFRFKLCSLFLTLQKSPNRTNN